METEKLKSSYYNYCNGNCFGRKKIRIDEENITSKNVVDILHQVLPIHWINSNQIDYLYCYYKGEQEILKKEKITRPEVNHKIVENRAREIVNFNLGYGFGEPIQYISRGSDEILTKDIDVLNEFLFSENKTIKDKELAEWMLIGGVGIRLVLPNGRYKGNVDEISPFKIYTLDPRFSFVVYHTGLDEQPVMGVKIIRRHNDNVLYSVYTKDMYFEIEDKSIIKTEPHIIGEVPFIEYTANLPRQGCFEPVIHLLDAINDLQSFRIDDIEQFVNSFLALIGCSIDEETVQKLQSDKMLMLPEGTDAKYLSTPMQQGDLQTFKDNLYQSVLEIIGMPNRNGGSSTSDTGNAVIMRDGWYTTESNILNIELMFKGSEKKFQKVALNILRNSIGTNLTLKDIDIKFSRRNYENIMTKVGVLTSMLASDKVHPIYAFRHSGLFSDPDNAFLESKKHYDKIKEENAKLYCEKQGQQDAPKNENKDKSKEKDELIKNEKAEKKEIR